VDVFFLKHGVDHCRGGCMRIAYQTVCVVLLATPYHLSACTLTGRLDRHWFRWRQFSSAIGHRMTFYYSSSYSLYRIPLKPLN